MDIFYPRLEDKFDTSTAHYPSVIPDARHPVDSFILDSRIINMKSRSVMKSIQNDGTAWNVL